MVSLFEREVTGGVPLVALFEVGEPLEGRAWQVTVCSRHEVYSQATLPLHFLFPNRGYNVADSLQCPIPLME